LRTVMLWISRVIPAEELPQMIPFQIKDLAHYS
jgi:hypothetical protein